MPNTPMERRHFHAVKFYESPEALWRLVAEFLGQGLVTRQPALIVATLEHRAGIVHELKTRHFDVDAMVVAGDLLVLDAEETLSTFMVNGTLDAELFRASATDMLERLVRSRRNCTIRVYGEIVDVLWKQNRSVDALRLEMLWNELAMTHDFSMVCGYAMRNAYDDSGVAAICREHTHVVTGDGVAAPVKPQSIN